MRHNVIAYILSGKKVSKHSELKCCIRILSVLRKDGVFRKSDLLEKRESNYVVTILG